MKMTPAHKDECASLALQLEEALTELGADATLHRKVLATIEMLREAAAGRRALERPSGPNPMELYHYPIPGLDRVVALTERVRKLADALAPISSEEIVRAIESADVQRIARAVADGDSFATEHLCLAAARGAARVVELLLDSDLLASTRDAEGVAPLCFAIAGGHSAMHAWLANPDDIDLDGPNWSRPIMLRRYADAAAVLIAHGADPDGLCVAPPNARQLRPLHLAAALGNTYGVELLLAHGAQASTPDAAGRRPADWASQRGHSSIAARLAAHGRATG